MLKFVVLLSVFVAQALSAATLPYTKFSSIVGDKLKQYEKSKDKIYPQEVGNGYYYQSDIMIPPTAYKAMNGITVAKHPNSRWTNAKVPYVISGTFSADEISIIKGAMKQFSDNTCVQFIPKTTEKTFLTIQNKDVGCCSYVGMNSDNNFNQLNLQTPGCLQNNGTPVHELMHAIGFNHEHVRPDRDSYVYINRSALAPEYNNDPWYNSAFPKTPLDDSETYGIPYNYASVMHYSKWGGAASYDYPVMNNIKPWGGDFGNDEGFDPLDIKVINYMYCNGTTTTKPITPAPVTTTTKIVITTKSKYVG